MGTSKQISTAGYLNRILSSSSTESCGARIRVYLQRVGKEVRELPDAKAQVCTATCHASGHTRYNRAWMKCHIKKWQCIVPLDNLYAEQAAKAQIL